MFTLGSDGSLSVKLLCLKDVSVGGSLGASGGLSGDMGAHVGAGVGIGLGSVGADLGVGVSIIESEDASLGVGEFFALSRSLVM